MIGKLTMENYILKKEKEYIRKRKKEGSSIKEGCRLMGIKGSTLYYQPKGNLDKKIKETNIKKKIEDISQEHPYYGYRRITAQLRRDKVIVNHKKVLKMMKE